MTNTILQCLPLLADILGRAYGVVVEVGGDTAFTTGRVIRLPSLPASGDAVFLGLVRGYIDHEAAHVRHTDFGAMNQAVMSPLKSTSGTPSRTGGSRTIWQQGSQAAGRTSTG